MTYEDGLERIKVTTCTWLHKWERPEIASVLLQVLSGYVANEADAKAVAKLLRSYAKQIVENHKP